MNPTDNYARTCLITAQYGHEFLRLQARLRRLQPKGSAPLSKEDEEERALIVTVLTDIAKKTADLLKEATEKPASCFCGICRIPLDQPGKPETESCGGDCARCMAECGDPHARKIMALAEPHSKQWVDEEDFYKGS